MDRYTRPILYAFEPKMTSVFAMVNFGAAGAPSFATSAYPLGAVVSNSKGLCNVALNVVSLTATTNTSTSLTLVSSFAGLYVGQSITGAGIPANTTIASMNAGAATITLSQAATASAAGVALSVSGGQYTLTFGSQFTPFKRLDAYPRLLFLHHVWDETALQGGVGVLASAPAAPAMFLVNNSISNSQAASLTVQFGTGSGASFVAAVPANGETVRIAFQFANSTAI